MELVCYSHITHRLQIIISGRFLRELVVTVPVQLQW